MNVVVVIVAITIILVVFIVLRQVLQGQQDGDASLNSTPKAKPKPDWMNNRAAPRQAAPGIDWGAVNHPDVQQYLPNRKIEAIKAYRELTGQGLKESKDAVEYAIAHPDQMGKHAKEVYVAPVTGADGVRDLLVEGKFEEAVDAYRNFTGVDYFTARNAVEGLQRDMDQAEASGISEEEIIDLLSAGKKIEAIKRYREATGLGLKEAKDAVDAIERSGRRSR